MGMITNVTSFSRSGLSDWLLQRVTAVVMAAYTVFITAYLLFNSGLDRFVGGLDRLRHRASAWSKGHRAAYFSSAGDDYSHSGLCHMGS